MAGNAFLISRRRWFRRLTLSFAGAGRVFAGRQTVSTAPWIAVQDFGQYPNVLTPNADFFVRNHFAQPLMEVSRWALRVDGAVEHPQSFRYGDLKSMRHRAVTAALECAGNEAGEGAVGCAVWSGPALIDLLRECGFKPGARRVRFVAADRGSEPDSEKNIPYARSIEIDKATEPDTLLALQMNGVPLPLENGFPARVLVPGFYAMDSVKWIEKIEVLEDLDDSFFTTHRYLRQTHAKSVDPDDCVGAIQIKSIIVKPAEAAVIRETRIDIGGYAWAGRERINRVEMTMDDGKSWRQVQLLTRSQPFSWVPWRFIWERAPSGVQTIAVRAFGAAGAVQPSTRSVAREDKYELNHHHQVTFTVVA
jgi:DMSO/TMAO reductase YedYZ molybdopterin-dependent catalytic subunit